MSPSAVSWARILNAAGLFALAVAGWMAYAAADHNPQGEFNGPDGGLSLARLLPIFGLWFVFAFVLAAGGAWVGWMIVRTAR